MPDIGGISREEFDNLFNQGLTDTAENKSGIQIPSTLKPTGDFPIVLTEHIDDGEHNLAEELGWMNEDLYNLYDSYMPQISAHTKELTIDGIKQQYLAIKIHAPQAWIDANKDTLYVALRRRVVRIQNESKLKKVSFPILDDTTHDGIYTGDTWYCFRTTTKIRVSAKQYDYLYFYAHTTELTKGQYNAIPKIEGTPLYYVDTSKISSRQYTLTKNPTLLTNTWMYGSQILEYTDDLQTANIVYPTVERYEAGDIANEDTIYNDYNPYMSYYTTNPIKPISLNDMLQVTTNYKDCNIFIYPYDKDYLFTRLVEQASKRKTRLVRTATLPGRTTTTYLGKVFFLQLINTTNAEAITTEQLKLMPGSNILKCAINNKIRV